MGRYGNEYSGRLERRGSERGMNPVVSSGLTTLRHQRYFTRNVRFLANRYAVRHAAYPGQVDQHYTRWPAGDHRA